MVNFAATISIIGHKKCVWPAVGEEFEYKFDFIFIFSQLSPMSAMNADDFVLASRLFHIA